MFVSYAHDRTGEHRELVLKFCEFLRGQLGVYVDLDVWDDGDRRNWSRWASERLGKADFVMVIASPEYKARAEGLAPPDEGRGVVYESEWLRDKLTEDRGKWTRRILPVVLPGHHVNEIPDFLSPASTTRFTVDQFTEGGAAELLGALTGEPSHQPPPLAPFVGRPQTKRTPVASPAFARGASLSTQTRRTVLVAGGVVVVLAVATIVAYFLATLPDTGIARGNVPSTSTGMSEPSTSTETSAPSTTSSPPDLPRGNMPSLLVGRWSGGSEGATAGESYQFTAAGDVVYSNNRTGVQKNGTVVVESDSLTFHFPGEPPQTARWETHTLVDSGYHFTNLMLDGYSYVRPDAEPD